MYRRRSRTFSRFRSRFKRRRRSLYPHSGGSYQSCQFYLPTTLASSEAFANTEWTELLKIEDHVGDSTSAQGSALNQIARYIEVRAVQIDWHGHLVVAGGGALAVGRGCLFRALAVDRLTNDIGRPPVAAANFDPFANESPVASVGSAAVDLQDSQQPTRWLRSKWTGFPTGDLDAVTSAFQSNACTVRWSFRFRRAFRLDDNSGLYAVRAFLDTTTGAGEGDTTYSDTCAGKLWYRVGFGR